MGRWANELRPIQPRLNYDVIASEAKQSRSRIGAVLGGADGAAAANFQIAALFAIVGGLIGATVGVFVGK